MIIVARIGSIEVCLDDETEGVTQTPEWIEDTAHRLGRQAVEIYNMLPDTAPIEADPE